MPTDPHRVLDSLHYLVLGLPLLSLLGLAAALRSKGRVVDPRLLRPLLLTMAIFNALGLALLAESLILTVSGNRGGDPLMGALTCLLEMGWLAAQALFTMRLLGVPPRPGLVRWVPLPFIAFILLAIMGMMEFQATSRHSVMGTLCQFVDYSVTLGLFGGALWVWSSAGSSQARGSKDALRSLAVWTIGIAALLGIWWSAMGYLRLRYPSIGIFFNSAVILAHNAFIARWLVKYGRSLTGEQGAPLSASGAFVKQFGISPREWEILTWIIKGNTNKEIAAGLFISAHTAKEHVANLLQKTGAKNRVQLTRMVLGSMVPTGEGEGRGHCNS